MFGITQNGQKRLVFIVAPLVRRKVREKGKREKKKKKIMRMNKSKENTNIYSYVYTHPHGHTNIYTYYTHMQRYTLFKLFAFLIESGKLFHLEGPI